MSAVTSTETGEAIDHKYEFQVVSNTRLPLTTLLCTDEKRVRGHDRKNLGNKQRGYTLQLRKALNSIPEILVPDQSENFLTVDINSSDLSACSDQQLESHVLILCRSSLTRARTKEIFDSLDLPYTFEPYYTSESRKTFNPENPPVISELE